MLSENACTHRDTVNGDAAFLPIGTDFYELKGYKPDSAWSRTILSMKLVRTLVRGR
jgi:hypothetical protein